MLYIRERVRSEDFNLPRSVLAGLNDKFVQRRIRNATLIIFVSKDPKGEGDGEGFGKRRGDRVILFFDFLCFALSMLAIALLAL